ncbi:NADH-ubiquinone oxidoreductase [Ectothiorhodospira haloalkaliphila]|uniref:NADH-ubiquinone oxidoreductase n=3 Tax=Ectothiorhodospira haloalkaliphila TaxID=421628 RepID=W8KFD9_9GAMM|nr:proton-conducting transporter membrane subunit [Ectothiorhodospira haloalkaliphila]AHK78504.1 NADH-ubiquinone oxidoreductase [Ectothiorhodospira haloalkaliphila]
MKIVFILPLLLPTLLAMLMVFPAARPFIWRLMPLAALPALLLALLAPVPLGVRGDWLLMGASFGLDEVSRLFLGFTALLWIAAGAAAREWFSGTPGERGFAVCFLLAMTGNLGLIIAQDALGFYAFFALMSFASYGLVVQARSQAAFEAGRLYIAFVILGELALFAGLALAASEAGSRLLADLRSAELSGLSASLLLLGFSVKLGIMPLHFWLPPAHGAAPVPASAVLSGAMIKAGLFGMLATLPLGTQALPDHGTVMMATGLVTIFAAVLLGLSQDNPKTVLGFSSVSQMGLIALGLGAGLMAPAAWPALLAVLVFMAAHHALAKGALFLGAGLFGAQTGQSGRVLALIIVAVPALVLAGAPATSGALAKEALKSALADGSEAWLPWLIVGLTLSGLATTLLMARFGITLWRKPPAAPSIAVPEGLVLSTLGLVMAAAALPFIWPTAAGPLAAPISAAGPTETWPLLLGATLALGAWIRARALAVGPQVFRDQIARPFVRVAKGAEKFVARQRRAAARIGRRAPAIVGERASHWRLGHTAVAALIVMVLIIEANGWK